MDRNKRLENLETAYAVVSTVDSCIAPLVPRVLKPLYVFEAVLSVGITSIKAKMQVEDAKNFYEKTEEPTEVIELEVEA